MKTLSQMSDAELQGLVRIARLIGNDPTDVFKEMGKRVARTVRDESPSYRAAMIDAGRGRLLR